MLAFSLQESLESQKYEMSPVDLVGTVEDGASYSIPFGTNLYTFEDDLSLLRHFVSETQGPALQLGLK